MTRPTLSLAPSDFGLPSHLFPSFRRGQYELAQRVESNPKRFSLVMAPPGSGKSLAHYIISKLTGGRSLTLVSTKALADQILRDPFNHTEIRGHSNYSCAPKIYDPTREISDLRCQSRGFGCGHQKAVQACVSSTSVLTNYALWVNLARTGKLDLLGKFDLLICDEGHLVHDLLSDLISVELYASRLSYLLHEPLPDLETDLSPWLEWVEFIQSRVKAAATQALHRDDKDLTFQLSRLDSELSRLLLESKQESWAVERMPSSVKFSPVWSSSYTEKYLFRGIPKVVISSGTLLPETAPLLGIDKPSHSYFQVSSTFPPERRPFIYLPTCRVDYRMSEGHWRMLVNRIDKIIEDRLDRKGIIHCRSYERGLEIFKRSKWSEIMLYHQSGNRDKVLADFKKSDSPCILVSPSVEEGHDFKGDLARYNILLKVPYADTRSPLTKERVKQNRQYGYLKAAEKILQQYGRSNRDEKDWSETFILDDHWGDYFHRIVTFPEYFKRAWRTSNAIPDPITF